MSALCFNPVVVVVLIKGKDRIIFVTKEDHEIPSNAELIAEDPNDPYEEQGQSLVTVKIIILFICAFLGI